MKLKESLKSKVSGWKSFDYRKLYVFQSEIVAGNNIRNNGRSSQLPAAIVSNTGGDDSANTLNDGTVSEPIRMSRIVGLHGKQAQMMIGHLSCLVIRRFNQETLCR